MFEFSESNLAKAGTLLLLEFVGGIALSFVLDQLGFNGDLAFCAAWLLNLLTAWYLYKAACYQRKRATLYGLLSALAPFLAMVAFFRLYGHDRGALWSASINRSKDEA